MGTFNLFSELSCDSIPPFSSILDFVMEPMCENFKHHLKQYYRSEAAFRILLATCENLGSCDDIFFDVGPLRSHELARRKKFR